MKKGLSIIGLIGLVIGISTVAAAQGQSTNLQVEDFHMEPEPLQAGEYGDIWLRVTNTGNVDASAPVIQLEDNFPFTPTERTEWRIPGGLGPGETYTLRAQVRVSENAVFGSNDLKIRKTTGNRDLWVDQKIPLEVRTDNRSLIVSELDFEERVEPGSSGDMSLTLENLAQSQFKNIDVTLETTDLPVATRETSRQRIASVGPDSSRTVDFTLDVDDDADNELHDLPIRIDYQDQAGNPLSMTETTGVNIGGFPNIDVAIEQSDIRTSGSGEVTFRVVNKGEGQARFTQVELDESEQYEILSEDSIYLGSMIADDFQTAEFDLYVEEDEKLELPVTVNYRDGQGDQTETFEVERNLYTSEELERYGLTQRGGTPLVILLVTGLAVAGIYYWRKRRKEE